LGRHRERAVAVVFTLIQRAPLCARDRSPVESSRHAVVVHLKSIHREGTKDAKGKRSPSKPVIARRERRE
jgi:hypothetical protein